MPRAAARHHRRAGGRRPARVVGPRTHAAGEGKRYYRKPGGIRAAWASSDRRGRRLVGRGAATAGSRPTRETRANPVPGRTRRGVGASSPVTAARRRAALDRSRTLPPGRSGAWGRAARGRAAWAGASWSSASSWSSAPAESRAVSSRRVSAPAGTESRTTGAAATAGRG